nr:helix-turn-helix domain-containing protein [Hyphomicrobium sp.]
AGQLRERVERLEAKIIRETLIRYKGNKSRTAEELGLSRVGLRAKLLRYDIDDGSDGDSLLSEVEPESDFPH